MKQAAEAVHQLANEDMAAAARLHLAELGKDAAALALVAYGGAGPVHACGLAARLGCKTVLVPPAAGVMSALGMLVADLSMERSRTLKTMLPDLREDEFRAALERLASELAEMMPLGPGLRPAVTTYTAEMRYFGQGYTVRVPVPSPGEARGAAGGLREAFDNAYRALYGRTYGDIPIELMNVRAVARAPAANPVVLPSLEPAAEPVSAAAKGTRRAWFADCGGYVDCAVLDRYRLRPGHVIEGPAIVEERETTVVLVPGARAGVDPNGTLRIALEAA